MSPLRLISLLLLWVGAGCAEVEPVSTPAAPESEDLVPFADGKADGHYFDHDHVIDDFAFEDGALMTEEEIQAFLAWTPYGRRSPLADLVLDDGRSVAAHMADAATTYGISPLVLLTRMQVEQGLVSAQGDLPVHRLEKALGCGCPDDGWCASALSGLATQLVCAAGLLRGYLEDLDLGDATVTGWKVAVPKESMDQVLVTPANRATAALYTYTPWSLPYEGGNWLHWNVYRKFASHVLEDRWNHRWIGGVCASDEDCPFDGGRCWLEGEVGVCTSPCEDYCPAARHHPGAGTFCADLGPLTEATLDGRCLAECDQDAYPSNEGCPDGASCVEADRLGEPATSREVCVP